MQNTTNLTDLQLLLNFAVDQTTTKIYNLLKFAVDLTLLNTAFDRVVEVAAASPDEARHAGGEALRYFHALCEGCDVDPDLVENVDRFFWNELTSWYKRAKDAENKDRKTWGNGREHIVESHCVGRWESRGGKYWVELRRGRYDYHYRGNNAGGPVCNPNLPIESAVGVIESLIRRGVFLPDNAVLPMKRVVAA